MADFSKNLNAEYLQRIRGYNQLQDSVVAMNLNGYVMSWNLGSERLFGYTSQEAIGQHISTFCSKASYEELKVQLIKDLPSKKTFQININLISKSGRRLFAPIAVSVLSNADGDPIGFISYSPDIEKHNNIEDVILESDELFRSTMSAMEDWVFAFDKDQQFTFYHVVAGEELFASQIEYIGRKHADIMPSDVDAQFKNGFTYCKNFLKGTEYTFSLMIGEKKHHFSSKMSPIIRSGEFDGCVCVLRDVTLQELVQTKLKLSEQKFRDLFENARDGVMFCDIKGNILEANPAFLGMLGYKFSELKETLHEELMPAKFQKFEKEFVIPQLIERGHADEYEKEYIRRDGVVFPVQVYARALNDDDGTLIGFWAYVRNIAGRRSMENYLGKLSAAVEQSPLSMMITDPKGEVEYVNARYQETMGEKISDIVGSCAPILNPDKCSEIETTEIWDCILEGKEWRGEIKTEKKDGSFVWEYITIAPIRTNGHEITNYLISKEDLTQHKEYERLLTYKSNFDALTDLPNRFLAVDRLSQMINVARRESKSLFVLFVDLDQFKLVNDTLGHKAGDQLLIEAAHRLKGCVRSSDTVARFGGDEFILLLSNYNTVNNDVSVARKVIDAFNKPFSLAGKEVIVTASIGIGVYPNDGLDANELLKNADTAAYQAKDEARNTFCFFKSELNQKAIERVELERDLRSALERQELRLYYQPIVETKTKKIVGAEALLRWFKAGGVQVSTGTFIPLAEETGLIIPIGSWVLEESCFRLSDWNSRYKIPLKVSINIAPNQFKTGRLVDEIAMLLQKTGLDPSMLELEITERMLMQKNLDAMSQIKGIKSLGVSIALDDFGTGYSSLVYLRKFDFDVLKIDRSFIQGIGINQDDETIIGATISMSHDLGLKVVAEGVETKEQADFLESKQSDYIQGYYFGRPVNHHDFTANLK